MNIYLRTDYHQTSLPFSLLSTSPPLSLSISSPTRVSLKDRSRIEQSVRTNRSLNLRDLHMVLVLASNAFQQPENRLLRAVEQPSGRAVEKSFGRYSSYPFLCSTAQTTAPKKHFQPLQDQRIKVVTAVEHRTSRGAQRSSSQGVKQSRNRTAQDRRSRAVGSSHALETPLPLSIIRSIP
jgi:hypothetical protein